MCNKEVADRGKGVTGLAGPSLVLGRDRKVSLKVDVCVVYMYIS